LPALQGADAAAFTLSQEHTFMKITNHPSHEYPASSNQPIPPRRDRCVISAAAAACPPGGGREIMVNTAGFFLSLKHIL